jgi:putative ABC transport system ATP-binding protein
VQTGTVVLSVIQRINEELGTTTAVITHNAVIAEIADRVITLTDGRVQETRRIVERKRVEELEW